MSQYLQTPFIKKLFCGSFLISTIILLMYYKTDSIVISYPTLTTTNEIIQTKADGYLVYSGKCKIPDVNPFHPEIIRFYHPENYTPCSNLQLLTYVSKIDNIATLHINKRIAPSYTKNDIFCCYSYVSRVENLASPDDHIKTSTCIPFKDNTTLKGEIVSVRCKNVKTKKLIYANTHAIIGIRDDFRNENKIQRDINSTISNRDDSDNSSDKATPISVLVVGIDSISRLNLIRSLPKTFTYLEKSNWLSLKGYNKIEDNTFPNLMAILTGYNQSRAYSICNPKKIGKLDLCPLLWYQYKKFGYVTAYAEDDTLINTFNYEKKGFSKEPTDFYFRPYMMASEKLKIVKKDDMTYCTGPETSGERILNLAKNFSFTFKEYTYFGLFWMNTFSHNKINSATGMDGKILNFLQEISNNGALDNTITIFLSDHGIRFGEIRYTSNGWLEERLPFIYISLPKWFKNLHPEEYLNLRNNEYKLTTPYDLHMTLQHIMVLSGLNHTMQPSEGCPNCGSLFEKIDPERSCEDASIEQHWCTCNGFTNISPKNKSVQLAAKFIIDDILSVTKSEYKCAKYVFSKIVLSSISEPVNYKNDTYLRIILETKPKAVFEGTVSILDPSLIMGENFKLVGSISRLDSYNSHSKCVKGARLKKYCYCRW